MKKIVFYLVGILFLSNISFSQMTFFVNGAIGNDTIAGAGSSSEKPFKTIGQATKIANEKSEIIVEGKHNGKEIEYKEYVLLDKIEMKFIGKNYPVLNGEIKESKSEYKNGITVNADFITIEGFVIKNYNAKTKNFLDFSASSGIFGVNDYQFTLISDCKISNCGNGIQLINPQLCKINNCEITGMKSLNAEDFKAGGIGICIFGTSQNLQAIEIGVTAKNIISDCENYGIFYGNIDSESFCESGIIKNNVIKGTKKNAAIYICNSKSNLHVVNNELINNYVGIKITGENSDLWIDENNFSNTTSTNEMISDGKYYGGLLKAFWFENKNKFDKPTFAVLSADGAEVFLDNNVRSIKNDKKSADDISKGKLKIITK